MAISALLLDLDGTLVDTAPDMVGTLHDLCAQYDIDKPDLRDAHRFVSDGSVALLRLIVGAELDDSKALWVERFLHTYERRIAQASQLYTGLAAVLDDCQRAGIPWGIVTNKPEYLSIKLVEALGLADRCACLIGGDTLPRRKPDPAPLLHAASLLDHPCETVLYVGDHQRDIDAARNAGMLSAAASWGYIKSDNEPTNWGADRVLEEPQDLARLLRPSAESIVA